jgi:hypothetical protein
MVHFPTLSSTAYVFSGGFSRISQRGFPHSEIPGSKPICGSPGLIAAYRVLHRLLMPRHSPYTLSSLTIKKLELTPCVLLAKNTLRQLHAHCACVVGKNYRLQDIQLSKITLLSRAQPSARLAAIANYDCFELGKPCGSPNLVENTGLEPVTSWLQTRRSPS